MRRAPSDAAFSALMSASCLSTRSWPPNAFSVSLNNPISSKAENSPTFSCGRNVHKLPICIFRSFSTSSFTCGSVALLPSIFHLDVPLWDLVILLSMVLVRPVASSSSNSNSVTATSRPVKMNSDNVSALPSCLGAAPNPTAMAITIELLPVPFGPMTTFNLGPGRNSTCA